MGPLTSALLLSIVATLTTAFPHNYPMTVGFTRLNFIPSPIQSPQAPLGYYSNQYYYPSHQRTILVWTPTTVIGHGNPEDNKVPTDDTVTLVNPGEEEKLKTQDGATQDGEASPQDDKATTAPEENTDGKEGAAAKEETKPEGEQQGHVLIPVQVPSPHLVPVVLVPPHYPTGFVQLVPVDNKATLGEPGKEDEQPMADGAEQGEVVAPEATGLSDKEDVAVEETGAEGASADDTVSLDNPDAEVAEAGSNDETPADTVSLDNPSLAADDADAPAEEFEDRDESKISEATADDAAVDAEENKDKEGEAPVEVKDDESPAELESDAQGEPESALVKEATITNDDEVAEEVPAAVDNVEDNVPELDEATDIKEDTDDEVSHSRLDNQ